MDVRLIDHQDYTSPDHSMTLQSSESTKITVYDDAYKQVFDGVFVSFLPYIVWYVTRINSGSSNFLHYQDERKRNRWTLFLFTRDGRNVLICKQCQYAQATTWVACLHHGWSSPRPPRVTFQLP